MTNAPISPSVEFRATDFILKGMDVIEAVKQALIDDIEFACEMASCKSSRAIMAREYLFNRHCKRIGKKKTKGFTK
jgi:hypothetical protein